MAKLKKDGTPRKKGSGRTKGSVSLVSIPLSKLKEKFNDSDLIVCGRVFLDKSGLMSDSLPNIKGPTPDEVSAGITITENIE